MKYTVTLQRPQEWAAGSGDIGIVQAWHKQIGDAVREGDVLAMVTLPSGRNETPVVSPAFGILTKKVVLPGEAVEVGEPVALLGGVPETFVTGAERVPTFFARAYAAHGPETVRTLSARETALARAFAPGGFSAPQMTVAYADVSEAVRLGAKLGLPLLPFVLHTVAESLTRFPDLNAEWVDSADGQVSVHQKRYINIGVARHGAEGLQVTVVRDAHHKSLRTLAEEVSALQTARDTGMLPDDARRGATFIVSQAPDGIAYQFGLLHSPLAAHLTCGAVEVSADHSRLTVCLTHDARIAAPETAALFLADVRAGLRDGRFLFAG